IMKAESDWHSGRSKPQVVEAMREELGKRPGVDFNFSQPITDRVEESISGIRGQVVVKIYGEDLGLMHDKLEQVKRILDNVRGSRDVDVYRAGSALHGVADIDRDATSPLGVAVREIEDGIESAYGGKVATEMGEGEREAS